jgi:serine/threonine protein kinase/tetratricopeptide (TPR) repeat protein
MSLEGKTISHYEVISQLGSGGMGVVYKAHDTRLKRDVALKFLPTELSRDDGANERFMQEAQAASALNHQNVCSIYDIKETEDGRLYIVMPIYDGNTLKYRIDDGDLSQEQAVDIAQQIAEGLAAAHKKGIVHRDIKPANIMLTDDGRVIILDFGLAKLAGGLDLTKTGSTVGTAFYMSPEQVRGEKVDRRADLWSLGVVFFQLLTGKRPFEGDYEQAVSYAILNHEPLAGSELPDDIVGILDRLLNKDQERRFESASEVASILKSHASSEQPVPDLIERKKSFILGKSTFIGIAAFLALAVVLALLQPWKSSVSDQASYLASRSAAEPERHSIAVLPFINLRSDPETDFLGYATADQVIGSLSYVRNLNVRPASSIRQYDGTTYDAREAGEQLQVDFVVAGNYLRQADRMRLTVEMVDVSANEIVWKEPIEVASGDVFAIQDIVSQTVLEKLEVVFSQQERDLMQADVSSNPLAYEYYLRAVSHPRTADGNQLALELLEQSLALDSTYAPAWSEMGFRRHSLGMFGLAGGDMSRSAEVAFERALALNPELISAIVDISTYYPDSGRTDEAYELAQRAIEINPNNAMGHFARGYATRYAGMMEESEREMRIAIDLDSTNVRFRTAGNTFLITKQYDDARRAFAIDAPNPYWIWGTGLTYLQEGRREDAKRILERSGPLEGGGLPNATSVAYLAYMAGDTTTGLAAARMVESAKVVDGEADYYIALFYCLAGDTRGCLRNLEKAVERGYFNYTNLQDNMFLEPVSDTPEFAVILEKARVKHERFRTKYFGAKP